MLGHRPCEIDEVIKALDADASDYSLAVLTPVGTARLNFDRQQWRDLDFVVMVEVDHAMARSLIGLWMRP